jgi:hypothetical protein
VLTTLNRAATESVYEIDSELADQVLEGLAAYPGVYRAEIYLPQLVDAPWILSNPIYVR